MYILHNRTTGVAEIHPDDTGEPTVLTNVSRHELPRLLWKADLILGPTSHWLQQRDGWHRHGLDRAS
jgi:hypothetical protein